MDDYDRGGNSKYSMKVYIIFSIGQVSQEVIEKYIQNQG